MRVPLYCAGAQRLAAILQYLDDRSPQGARNVKRSIRQTIAFIGQHPQIGRRASVQEARVLPAGRYPYLIYWSIEAGEAWIVHIRHAARRPWEGTD